MSDHQKILDQLKEWENHPATDALKTEGTRVRDARKASLWRQAKYVLYVCTLPLLLYFVFLIPMEAAKYDADGVMTRDAYTIGDEAGDQRLFYFLAFILAFGAVFAFFANILIKKITQKPDHGYTQKYKSLVWEFAKSLVDDSWKYDSGLGIASAEYKESLIQNKSFDRYLSDDYFAGDVDGYIFKAGEINTVTRGKSRTSSGTYIETEHPQMSGFMYIFELKENYNGSVVMLRDVAEKAMGKLGRKMQAGERDGMPMYRVEDDHFEKSFVVYADSTDAANKFFTMDTIDKLNQLSKKYRGDIQFSVINNKFFVFLDNDSSSIQEPKGYKGEISHRDISGAQRIFQVPKDIVWMLKEL